MENTNPTETDNNVLTQLADLSLLQYDRVRIAEAKALGIRPATLDSLIKAIRAAQREEKSESPFAIIKPWHEPVNPDYLFNEIAYTITRYIVCSPETTHAATLWIAMTWLMDSISVAPLAIITAPEKRCGKSQMLSLLGRLVCRPLVASNITPSALFRSIDAWQPTLLIDEADSFMRENEELRGLINCGHTRDSAYIVRVVGDDHKPKSFFVWGAKAIAGIGQLADTIMDRAIILKLRRKRADEKVERLRHAEKDLFNTLTSKLARFAQDYASKIQAIKPDLPDALNDRAQDNWEPLFAIAAVVGRDWPRLAYASALKLTNEREQSQSISIELLADIQEIFQSKNIDRMSSAELIAALCADEEKMWVTYNRGFPIKPRQIASRLKDFSIISNTIRIGYTTAKGYLKSQFTDAFTRYLDTPHLISVTTTQVNHHVGLNVTDQLPVTDRSVTNNQSVTG
jgi:putative DNA primase/helicase